MTKNLSINIQILGFITNLNTKGKGKNMGYGCANTSVLTIRDEF